MNQNNYNIIKEALVAAEKALNENDGQKILTLLNPFKEKIKDEELHIQNFFNRLLAFGYVLTDQITKSEEICKEILKQDDEQFDCYFITTFVHLRLREYDKAFDSYQKYAEKLDPKNNIQISSSRAYQSQAANFAGSALMEQGEFEKSVEYFRKSLETDKTNHLPYINLVRVYNNLGRLKEAQEILELGLKNCTNAHDLRLLKETIKQKPTVSACMIVKNEQELLPGCLESIRDWVDEIILVDTGSTDKTVEIAESYGAKVYHQMWEGNFSKHRNYSTSLANSDWIFIIDADERMLAEDLPRLNQYLSQPDNRILSINVFNVYGKREETTTFLPSVRFWRKEVNLQYEGIVHNLLKIGQGNQVVRADVRLKHLGYDLSKEKMAGKFNRTKSLLEKQLKEDPENIFALFNYAQLLKGDKTRGDEYPTQNIPEIIKAAQKAVKLSSPAKKDERHLHLMCLDQLAWAHFYKKDFTESLRLANLAIEIKNDYLDPLLLIGHIFAQQKMWEDAREAYNRYLDVQSKYDPLNEVDPLILAHVDSRTSALYSLGLIAENSGELDLAKKYYHLTLDVNEGYMETNFRLGQIYLRERNFDKAEHYFNKQIQLSNTTTDTLVGLAYISSELKNYAKVDELYKKAMELDRFDNELKIKYGKYLLSMNKSEQASELFEKILKDGGDADQLYMEIADTYYKIADYSKALEYFSKISENNINGRIFNEIGNCYFKMKQYDKAVESYHDALRSDKTMTLVYRNLGLGYAGLQENNQAVSYLEQYFNKCEDFSVCPIIGDLLQNEKNYTKALDFYEKYLMKYPSDSNTLFLLSDCYLNMGHRDSAIAGYRRVLELNHNFKPAEDRLRELEKKEIKSLKN